MNRETYLKHHFRIGRMYGYGIAGIIAMQRLDKAAGRPPSLILAASLKIKQERKQ